MPSVMVLHADGRVPKRIPQKQDICPGFWGTSPPPIIEPGESIERPFWIVNDPSDLFGGIKMPPGTYVLTVRSNNIRTVISTAEINILGRTR